MKITIKTSETLDKALQTVNKKFEDNIIFNRCDFESNTRDKRVKYTVTLKCKDSKEAGHRLGFSENKNGDKRRLINACWHVHGEFFDSLRNIEDDCVIKSNGEDYDGVWQDRNIGSVMNPMYFSEACEC